MTRSPSEDFDPRYPTPTAAPTRIGLRTHTDLSPSELRSVEEFASERETAVLAIMFTDIEGFTRLTERLGDQATLTILDEHNALLKSVVERGDRGRRIKTIGDGMLAVFAEPSVAVSRALEIQAALAERNRSRPPEDAIRVRIGLHMGQVTVEGGVQIDVVGGHVNRAARVESLASGGQTYATQAICENAKGYIEQVGGKPLAWRSHGRYTIRGIEDPVDIHEVGIDGETKFAPPPPGPNCQPLRLQSWTRGQRARAYVLIVLLSLLSAAVILASIRVRNGRIQEENREIVEMVLRENDLRVAPSLEQQQEWMPGLPFESGNAALDYIRIPAIRLAEKAGHLLERDDLFQGDELEEEWKRLVELSNLLVTSKVHSRLTLANNRLEQGGGLVVDFTQPVVRREQIEFEPGDHSPTCGVLDALETGASKRGCTFYPQVIPFPRSVKELAVFNLDALGMVHRAQMARALIHELDGESDSAVVSLLSLLRFNYHLSSNVNSFEELYFLLRYRRQVLLALTDVYKRQGDLASAARWSGALAREVALMQNAEKTHSALFDQGYRRAHYGAAAAVFLLEQCREDFWTVQAGLCLGLTQAQRWNFFDRALARKALEEAVRASEAAPRVNGFLRLFSQLKASEHPDDLALIMLVQ